MREERPDDDDGWTMIRLEPLPGETPPESSTGNDDDDQVLRQIALHSSLDLPRDWQFFLLMPDEQNAVAAARGLTRAGPFEVAVVPPDAEAPAWCLIAELKGAVLTPKMIRGLREMFEKVASQIPGAVYDGWQASIDTSAQSPA
jgi:hypothetical protein